MRLEAQNANAGYTHKAADKPVLQDVTLQCASGAFVGLIGPNGCGKSTLLRVLSGILRPTQGRVLLDERPLNAYAPREIARRMAFVPQEEKAAFEFSARDVVLMGRFPYRAARRGPSEEDYAHVDRALAALDITALQHRSITELSGGEHRRVLLARALAQQTPLLLLDEPTAHLDITHQAELLLLMRALAHPLEEAHSTASADQSDSIPDAGDSVSRDEVSRDEVSRGGRGENRAPIGVLAALHDLNQAAEFCDRLVLMVEGRIVAQGTPEQVLTPAHIRTAYQADADIELNPVTNRPMLYALRPLRSQSSRPAEPLAAHFSETETPASSSAS